MGPGGGSDEPIATSPSQYPKVMSWPVGSFSTPLTEFNKVYYKVTLDDETPVEIYYNEESKKWGVTSVPGKIYMINSDGDGGITITNDYMGRETVKALTKEQVQALKYAGPARKELIYAKDDVFSFTKDGSGNWIRRAQYMVFQPGSITPSDITSDKSTWRIFELSKPIENFYSLTFEKIVTLTHLVIVNGYTAGYNIYTIDNNQFRPATWLSGGSRFSESSAEAGTWRNGDSYFSNGITYQDIVNDIDAYARTHTFGETWYTLEEYNKAGDTSYTF